MGISEPLLSAAGIAAAVIAMLADGRRAVVIAVVVIPAGLAPTVVTSGGAPSALVLAGAGAAGVVLGLAGRVAAGRLPWIAGLDPLIPAFAPGRQLFGPRSVRVFAAALAVPVASWVSFNVPIGEVTAVQGLLFPVAYVWACGGLRLLVARSLEDLAVGVAMVALAVATAWMLRGGEDALTGGAAVAGLAPIAALVAGWMGGRHARRPAPHPEPAS